MAMTRVITLAPESAALSEGALALIKAIKTFEKDVLPSVSAEVREREGLAAIAEQTKACRQSLESLREKLMLAAAGNAVLPRRRR
jgi:hypothetical protein